MRFAALAVLLAATLASACAVNNPSYVVPPAYARAPDLQINFVDAGGADSGGARLWETPRGVFIALNVTGAISPGWHGIHFHEHGDCSGPSFTSAGAHAGRGDGRHGLLNAAGPEAGDLPNFLVAETVTPSAELFSPLVTLSAVPADGRVALRDADGAALVIHANADDQLSQPIGGAGNRIFCAIIPPAS